MGDGDAVDWFTRCDEKPRCLVARFFIARCASAWPAYVCVDYGNRVETARLLATCSTRLTPALNTCTTPQRHYACQFENEQMALMTDAIIQSHCDERNRLVGRFPWHIQVVTCSSATSACRRYGPFLDLTICHRLGSRGRCPVGRGNLPQREPENIRFAACFCRQVHCDGLIDRVTCNVIWHDRTSWRAPVLGYSKKRLRDPAVRFLGNNRKSYHMALCDCT